MAETFLGWGVSCLKVKVGLDSETDVARVRAVREVAGPDVAVTLDANCGWTIQQAKQMNLQPKLFGFSDGPGAASFAAALHKAANYAVGTTQWVPATRNRLRCDRSKAIAASRSATYSARGCP